MSSEDKIYMQIVGVFRPLRASAMTVGSWHLMGIAPTLATAFARHCTHFFVPLLA
jgi:hypothetical protein